MSNIPGRLPDNAWILLRSDSPDRRDGGALVSWHESELAAEKARDAAQGEGPPHYRVEPITRAKLGALLSNPSDPFEQQQRP